MDAVLNQWKGAAASGTGDNGESSCDIKSSAQNLHTSGVRLPDGDDFRIVKKVTDYVASNLAYIGRPRWFPALLVALAAQGIPWNNLLRFAGYYTLRDFAFAGNQLFFVALLPQKGGGLGCIPLPLPDDGSLIEQIARSAFADYRTRNRLFVKDGVESLGKILKAAGVEKVAFFKAVGRVPYYRCHSHYSGFIAAGLSGRLVIPCNYIAEADIFESFQMGTPRGLDGESWTSPHAGKGRWMARHSRLADKSLQMISVGAFQYRTGSRGKGVPLPGSLHALPSTWNTAQWMEFAQLFGPVPNVDTIERWMELAGNQEINKKTARRAALQVQRKLRDDSRSLLDPSVRFIPWHRIMELVSALIDELKCKYPGKRGQRLIIGVLIAIVLGPRPKETHALHRQDIRVRGELICALIRGVKKTPRARRDAIANLPGKNEIRGWVVEELRERLATLKMEEGSRLCDYDSSSLRQFREDIQIALRSAAGRVFGSSNGINYYTLRHLCECLLLYSALTKAGEKNFYNLLGTIAANMGHSLPELLGGYVGTGLIAILWEANLLPGLVSGMPGSAGNGQK